MLLGILLHAAITYMQRPMDGLLWPLREQPQHVGFDLLFWWIHGWRIPLFFVMAGFFAAMLARRRGPGGFIRHRVLRILIPVTLATFILLPAMYFIWGWGWVIESRATWHEVVHVHFKDDALQDRFRGPAHLWFLNYLVVYSFVYWAIMRLRGNSPQSAEPALGPTARRLFTTPLRPLIFALPTFGMLVVDPGFYFGYHHVLPESPGAWGYELAQLVYQGYFFVVGVYLFRLHREMDAFKRYAWMYLVLGTLMFIVLARFPHLGYFKDHLGVPEIYPLAACIALFCWFMIWGMTGLGLTVLARPRAVVRWLSDSAYWVYLVHLPIVALLLIVMRDWPIGPWPRFVLIVVVTSVLTLVSYQWGVRHTPIGRLLNGPRGKV